MRRVRGTAFDLFGRAHVRKVERELVREYTELLDVIGRHLDQDTFAIAVELAGLPDMVRGYEDVKLGNVERYRERVAELRARLEATSAPGARSRGGGQR